MTHITQAHLLGPSETSQETDRWRRTTRSVRSEYNEDVAKPQVDYYKFFVHLSRKLAVTELTNQLTIQLTDYGLDVISDITDRTLNDYIDLDETFKQQTSCYAGRLARRLYGDSAKFNEIFEEYAFILRKNKYIAIFRAGLNGTNNCRSYCNQK